MEFVDLGQLLGLGRFVVAAVEEAAIVLGPGCSGELDPPEQVRQILARLDVADSPFLPVGPAGGQAVGQPLAVFADGSA